MKILDIEYDRNESRCVMCSRMPPYLAIHDQGAQVEIYITGEAAGQINKTSLSLAAIEKLRDEAARKTVSAETTPPEAA